MPHKFLNRQEVPVKQGMGRKSMSQHIILERIKQNDGKVLLPKTSIGEYGFVANFEDSEGNKVSLHSMK